MYNLGELSNDEIKYICEHMQLQSVRTYLQKNPKEFNKIKPGFTVKKMSDSDILAFLIKYFDKPFVQTLIKEAVNNVLLQIQNNVDSLKEQGFSSGEAFLKVIPNCFFAERIELYFKLSNKEYDDKYLKLISDSLSLVKKISTSEAEEHDTKIVNEHLIKSNSEITKLKKLLLERESCEDELHKELANASETIQNYQHKIAELNDILQRTEMELYEKQIELERFHKLQRYTEGSIVSTQIKQYQHTSICQVSYDNYNKIWIYRLADINENGLITSFIVDRNIPRYFANRDRLSWKNGPNTDKTIGVWNWNASPRDTDPEKDYLETDYCYSINITQIVCLSSCESLDDVANLLKCGLSIPIICNKMLFVYEEDFIFKGLLCSSMNFDKKGDTVTLKPNIYTLPCYGIPKSDVIEIANIKIPKYISLGMPQSIFQVRDPYETAKTLILSHITNASFREYELSKKEIQHCRQVLKDIPDQTVLQEMMDAYNCSEETAQGYIEEFVKLADEYLLYNDLDTYIFSRAVQSNPVLLDLCKQQLTDEWKSENIEKLAEAESKLNDILDSIETKRDEINKLSEDKKKLSDEMEQLQSMLSQREQLASEVETKIALQIESAKQNAADFISNMAFVAPISVPTYSNLKQLSKSLSVFNSHINCVQSGKIDDVDSFEDNLSDNLEMIGYNKKQAIEITQAISFGIIDGTLLLINNNARLIAQCLAATLNGGLLSELFIPIQGACIEEISDAINNNVDKTKSMVYLVHGILDSYSTNLFNAVANIAHNWESVIVLLSLEGIPSNMIPLGVLNHAIYVDGNIGFEKQAISSLKQFTILDSFNVHDTAIAYKSEKYNESKKIVRRFAAVLSNIQISIYSRYLSVYDLSLNNSELILKQLIIAANSAGNVEQLKELFRENGISNGEKMIETHL